MKDVTDVAFRALVAARGKPDVFWTEFVAADGLYHTIEMQGDTSLREEMQGDTSLREESPCISNPLLRDLAFDREVERPIVAQIFSSKPDMIAYATRLVAELGFDGVDINMGCPDRAIEKQGCGSAMIKNPALAREIIKVAKESSNLPVSVKTRIGYTKESLDEWLPVLLEAAPAAITIHLRTRKELSLVPADWELMKKAVEIRNKINPEVLIIGNGDVESVEQGRQLALETGRDGIMIGRGMFGNPWVFASLWDSQGHRMSSFEIGHPMSKHGLGEKLEALVELAHNFEKITPPKNFSILKKHIKAFVTGFSGAADLRAKLMEASNASDLERILRENPV